MFDEYDLNLLGSAHAATTSSEKESVISYDDILNLKKEMESHAITKMILLPPTAIWDESHTILEAERAGILPSYVKCSFGCPYDSGYIIDDVEALFKWSSGDMEVTNGS